MPLAGLSQQHTHGDCSAPGSSAKDWQKKQHLVDGGRDLPHVSCGERRLLDPSRQDVAAIVLAIQPGMPSLLDVVRGRDMYVVHEPCDPVLWPPCRRPFLSLPVAQHGVHVINCRDRSTERGGQWCGEPRGSGGRHAHTPYKPVYFVRACMLGERSKLAAGVVFSLSSRMLSARTGQVHCQCRKRRLEQNETHPCGCSESIHTSAGQEALCQRVGASWTRPVCPDRKTEDGTWKNAQTTLCMHDTRPEEVQGGEKWNCHDGGESRAFQHVSYESLWPFLDTNPRERQLAGTGTAGVPRARLARPRNTPGLACPVLTNALPLWQKARERERKQGYGYPIGSSTRATVGLSAPKRIAGNENSSLPCHDGG
ncbi:hypothetical protein CMQ_4320 [Grosmannia clavigera kw1407]|uniref:Uncharacterized protein n=1 Tax=Grosmannia clavigera (strain kw1407 / UAMH 11150) TaxID=655863 RepID=F0XTQ0_GROCL|nr:uncharacterized protein CMQ_4320 [Grosmannia clavigera kw1407]EFW98468.1 hypothetical protein CMQ_4320 [Grosmannia clavigera kw1407]